VYPSNEKNGQFLNKYCGATWWPVIFLVIPLERSWLVDGNRVLKYDKSWSGSKVMEQNIKAKNRIF
jgi:hypothetical protein